MKKNGFTLVEVLMTLGIISVVGILVTPSLMQNGRNETNAARLSTAVSNFENGIQAGMAADNREDLYQWNTWTGNNANIFYGQLTRFMALSGNGTQDPQNGDAVNNLAQFYPAANPPANMGTDGARNNNGAFNPNNIFTALTAKNGTVYLIADKSNLPRVGEDSEAVARAAGRTLYSKAADVIIDVNGTTRPNIVGRDIFVFMLSSEGTLFPYGSRETAAYEPAITQWNNGGCSDNNGNLILQNNDSSPCTARVVENGYRIDY